MRRILLTIIGVLGCAFCMMPARAEVQGAIDSISVVATEKADSVTFWLTTDDLTIQMTFLMQGLRITVEQDDSLTLIFPSAMMVRGKMRHHPNEVKPSFAGNDSIRQMVRPDILPLLAALNDTTALTESGGKAEPTKAFSISVDRETGIMVFSMTVAKDRIASPKGEAMGLRLSSMPTEHGTGKEFGGNRLSQERRRHPQGFGEGVRREDFSNRTIMKALNVKILTEADAE